MKNIQSSSLIVHLSKFQPTLSVNCTGQCIEFNINPLEKTLIFNNNTVLKHQLYSNDVVIHTDESEIYSWNLFLYFLRKSQIIHNGNFFIADQLQNTRIDLEINGAQENNITVNNLYNSTFITSFYDYDITKTNISQHYYLNNFINSDVNIYHVFGDNIVFFLVFLLL